MATIIITVEHECCRCSNKIQKLLCCIKERGEFAIEKITYDKDKVEVSGPFDAEKLACKLCCKAGRIIKKIEIVKPPPKIDKPLPQTEKPKPEPCKFVPFPCPPSPCPQPSRPCSCPPPYCHCVDKKSMCKCPPPYCYCFISCPPPCPPCPPVIIICNDTPEPPCAIM